jgi:hypothetical protein
LSAFVTTLAASATRRPAAPSNPIVAVPQLRSVAFIGNSLPRRCGIATFTTDLQQAIAKAAGAVETAIVAMTDHGHSYDYPAVVRHQIEEAGIEGYGAAAVSTWSRSSTNSEFSAVPPATTSWRCCPA